MLAAMTGVVDMMEIIQNAGGLIKEHANAVCPRPTFSEFEIYV